MLWKKSIPKEEIKSNQIHIWKALLDVSESQTDFFLGLLSSDEVERANRFHFEKDRKRFISGRGMLRQILSFYLNLAPSDIQFDYTSLGKPFLLESPKYKSINFNLSHSGSYALYAFTSEMEIGVDIELINNDIVIDDIIHRFFSSNEISSIDRVNKSLQHELFFQYWTRKEALLKATGKGLSYPLEEVDVSIQNKENWSVISLVNDQKTNLNWYWQDLSPVVDYKAAVAADRDDCDIFCWDFVF